MVWTLVNPPLVDVTYDRGCILLVWKAPTCVNSLCGCHTDARWTSAAVLRLNFALGYASVYLGLEYRDAEGIVGNFSVSQPAQVQIFNVPEKCVGTGPTLFIERVKRCL